MTFFGLTQSSRIVTFRKIHEIVFHGKGGYSWDVVYNMPIWLRNYTFSLLQEHYSEKEKTQQPSKTVDNKITIPDYIAKAPRN